MVLGHILLEHGLHPVVAHCNFGLRGAESDLDAEFVKKWSKENHLDFYQKKFNTKRYAQEHSLSTQMAARELRYAFFNELLKSKDLDFIAVAHHADDSLETMLINLGRGTGFKGLSGIQPVNGNIIRPLWQCTRKQLLNYAEANSIQWREDSSNSSDDYQRNYLRHHAVPKLKEQDAAYETGLVNSIGYLNHDLSFFSFQLNKVISELTDEKKGIHRLHIPSLLKVNGFEAVLNSWLNRYGNFDTTAIIDGLEGESGKTYFTKDFELLKDRELLLMRRKIKKESPEHTIKKEATEIQTPLHLRIVVKNTPLAPIKKGSPNEINLDFDKLSFPLTLRKWQKGDSFVPLGMKGQKKLQDFFTDLKLNRFEKEDTWLLCSGDDIIWIVGHRIDNRYKVVNSTKTIYFVRLVEA